MPKKLLVEKTVTVDFTTLEAVATMKSIDRRNLGEDWLSFGISLMRPEKLPPDGKEPTRKEVPLFKIQREG